MLIRFAGVQRLPWQSGHQIATVARQDPELADDVVHRLAATAEMSVVDGRCVVLHVDPMSDDHGRGHDRLQHGTVGIVAMIVAVKKRPRVQVDASRERAWRDDERGVTGQTPLRSHLGPVGRAPQQIVHRRAGDRRHSLPTRSFCSGRRMIHQLLDFSSMTGWNIGVIEVLDKVCRRVVHRGQKERVGRYQDATIRKRMADVRLIQQHGRQSGVRFARMAAACAAVQACGQRIVFRFR